MSLVPKKTTTKSIDYLKILENVVHKADEMNLMCVSISIGRRGKQKKFFVNAQVSGVIDVLKTSTQHVSLIRFVTQDITFQKSLKNEIRRKSIDERKKTYGNFFICYVLTFTF